MIRAKLIYLALGLALVAAATVASVVSLGTATASGAVQVSSPLPATDNNLNDGVCDQPETVVRAYKFKPDVLRVTVNVDGKIQPTLTVYNTFGIALTDHSVMKQPEGPSGSFYFFVSDVKVDPTQRLLTAYVETDSHFKCGVAVDWVAQ